MNVALNRLQFPVTSLGYGRRIGIWLQGCSIRCPGCIVPETWQRTPSTLLPLEALLFGLERWLSDADGVTISGGEPFDQAPALAQIVAHVRARSRGDILVYSGYPLDRLERNHAAILDAIDALIAEPFHAGEPDPRPFIGSSNQRISLRTSLGRERYDDLAGFERRLDVAVVDGAILFAGVPERGVLEHIAEGLRERGYRAETTHDAV